MKVTVKTLGFSLLHLFALQLSAQKGNAGGSFPSTAGKHLFIDVHQLEPGKVKPEDVAAAHEKDLATEGKYGVDFMNYWFDKDKGLVYCLSSCSDSSLIRKVHAEAHGLQPSHIYVVSDGRAAAIKNKQHLFMDIHYLGAGKVNAEAVAGVHQKDLATQKKYGVNFINYWVDEKEGVVMCLAEAKDSASIVNTHKEAHGLLPARVSKVSQGE